MLDSNKFEASFIDSGNTCPVCQKPIVEKETLKRCSVCSSINHLVCWDEGIGCGSYDCKQIGTGGLQNINPDVVIHKEEVDRVNPLQIPKPRIVRKSRDVAAEYQIAKPTKINKLSIMSIILVLISCCGIIGIISDNSGLLIFGSFGSVLALVLAIISSIQMNHSQKTYGMKCSLITMLLSIILLITYLIYIDKKESNNIAIVRFDIDVQKQLPSEESIASIGEIKANALKANVVIYTRDSLTDNSIGSGVIIKFEDKEVYIITNKHVVGKSNELKVIFYTGEESKAKVIWSANGDVDLAVIKCEGLTLKDFTPPTISQKLEYQSVRVFAVGNPNGLYWTYTEGVISGVRTKSSVDDKMIIYQTQTPINYGNSGGGLYDFKGRLIGINTWIYDKSTFEGLNFSISTITLIDILKKAGNLDYLENIMRREIAGEKKI
jgi:S1-C subfamily serine protease